MTPTRNATCNSQARDTCADYHNGAWRARYNKYVFHKNKPQTFPQTDSESARRSVKESTVSDRKVQEGHIPCFDLVATGLMVFYFEAAWNVYSPGDLRALRRRVSSSSSASSSLIATGTLPLRACEGATHVTCFTVFWKAQKKSFVHGIYAVSEEGKASHA